MTIQELGSLGELLAAVATIATLIYLALQIRQNTSALRDASWRAVMEEADHWRGHLIDHSEVADLYRKGLLDPDSLDPTERVRFRLLLDALFSTWLYMFRADQAPLEDMRAYVSGILRQPGGEVHWARVKARFDPDFVEHIDSLNHEPDTIT